MRAARGNLGDPARIGPPTLYMRGYTLYELAIDALLLAEHASQAFWTEGVSQDTVNALFILATRRR